MVDVTGLDVPDAYRHKLVLCRSDQHVAWRGDAAPASASALFDTLRGASPVRSAADEARR